MEDILNIAQSYLMPTIDLILFAVMLYYAYKLVKGTAAINIFLGFVIIYIIWSITELVNMPILSNILGGFISVGLIALIVVFQQEIRKFLLLLGSSNITNNKNILRKFNLFFKISKEQAKMDIDEFISSCETLKKKIEDMKKHEDEHCSFFEDEIKKRNISPTKFLPLWDLLGLGLGFGSTILGKKAAMLCTASVEEVIDEHYLNQINQIKDDEKKLREKIKKFRQDEIDHKDIAYEEGATKKGLYSVMDKVIKTGSRIAINISEKI